MVQVLINSIVTGAMYALVAVTFSRIYSISKVLHFAYAGVYTVSAYTYYIVLQVTHGRNWLAAAVAVAIAGILGGAIERLVYRPLRMRHASGLTTLLASLGVLIVVQNSIAIFFGDLSRTLHSGKLAPKIEVLGAYLTPLRAFTVVISLCLILVCWFLLRFTRFGLKVRAVADNQGLASVAGLDNDKIILWTTAIASAISAVAAICQAYDTGIDPLMGFNILLMGVVAAVVGGMHSLLGAFAGGFLVALVQNLGTWVFPNQWQDTFVFVLLIAFLLSRVSVFRAIQH